MRKLLSAVASLVLCAPIAFAQLPTPDVGARAPGFTLKTFEGQPVSLAAVNQSGPVVLVLLRGYPGYQCPFCVRQVHDFNESAASFAALHAQILLVYPGPPADLDAHAKEFLSKQDKLAPNVHLVLDPDYSMTNLYGLRWDAPRETAYPTTFLLDRHGVIVFRKISHSHGDRTTAADTLADWRRPNRAASPAAAGVWQMPKRIHPDFSHPCGISSGERIAYVNQMRMTVLASGSKGNSTVISSSRTRVLVDCGLSCREILKRMAQTGEDPATLDAILVTHEHIDHVSGLPVLARKLGIPVYFTEATHRAWVRMMTPRTTMSYAQWLDHLQAQKLARAEATAARFSPDPAHLAKLDAAAEPAAKPSHRSEEPEPEDCSPELAEKAKVNPTFLPSLHHFRPGKGFTIGDIAVSPFTTPHDAADPCGFVFEADGVRMAVATDLGYIPPNVKSALQSVDALLLESNHDLEMLRDGPYPWSVKQRVLSRVGHLSNDATAEFLMRDYDGGAQFIVLGHISESNNAPELARLAAERALNGRMSLLGNRVLVATQSTPLEPINI